MALKETLKKLDQTQREADLKLAAIKTESERVQNEFTNAVKPCFENIVMPKLNEIIDIFNGAEYNRKYRAKHIHAKDVTYMSALQKASINIEITKLNLDIQIDIVANPLIRKIQFNSMFIGLNKTFASKNNKLDLTVQETTSESIEEFIEKQITSLGS